MNARRIPYLSFSNAGWFCNEGLRADNRPVSVLMFTAPCTRPSGPRISSPCNGMIKLDNKVSTAARSLSASMAAHARAPSKPLPNASNAVPQILDNFSFFLSSSGKESQLSQTFRAAPGLPANCRKTTLDTAGRPVAVYVNTGNGLFVIPCKVIFAVFFGALPSLPLASHSSHSCDSCVNSLVFSTPGLSLPRLFLAPANKS